MTKAASRKVESFEDVFIWRRALEFAKEIDLVTDKGRLKSDFGLSSQLRRAAVFGFDKT